MYFSKTLAKEMKSTKAKFKKKIRTLENNFALNFNFEQ